MGFKGLTYETTVHINHNSENLHKTHFHVINYTEILSRSAQKHKKRKLITNS